ncbi:MAG: D-alanyl-D-alanine carboxypeptidase [Candidatus Nomurabacteria bacterium]|nr:D-alanyl-D-alanine carboxypeptidase [Candidatus Nomurabacteria bacterium]USN87724.1 MAG: D-alanyl-D-alanine carboxypeptidase [Candidatus Nomurabacteria bacterium]
MHRTLGLVTFLVVSVLMLFNNDSVLPNQQLASAAASFAEPQFWIAEDAKREISELPVADFAIFDAITGEILVTKSKYGNQKLPIASVTKLVTASVINDDLDLGVMTTITKADVDTEGRSGKLKVGEEYTYRELLFPLLLESSNDAATVFERVTGGDLISAMNSFAQGLGAANTSFADASGLSSRNVSTVSDLALITSYLYQNQSHVLDITKLSQYIGPYTGWVNNNPVLGSDYVGGKHGYTEAANRTIVSLFNEDFTTGKRVVGYVVLGSDDVRSDVATLRQFVAQAVKYE